MGKPAATPGGAAGERSSRETESSSTGGTEERETRGNSKIRCRQSRKMQEPGQLGECIGRRNWKSEERGNPNRRTRGAEGHESWGNPRIGRRQGRKMQRPGQPVMHRQARRAKWSCGGTRNFKTAGSAERSRNPGQLGDRTPAEPEDEACGATQSRVRRRYLEERDRGVTHRSSAGSAEG